MNHSSKELIIAEIGKLKDLCQNKDLFLIPFEERVKPIFNRLFSMPDLPSSAEAKLIGAMSDFEVIGKRKQMMSDELQGYTDRILSYLYDAKDIVENPI